MRCRESRELISAFYDDTLDPEEIGALHEHLRDCRACKSYLEEGQMVWEGVRVVLRGQPGPIPDPDFSSSVLAAFGSGGQFSRDDAGARRRKRQGVVGPRRRAWLWVPAIGAACVFALMLIYQANWQGGSERVHVSELRAAENAAYSTSEVDVDDLVLDHILRSSEHPLIGVETTVAVITSSSASFEPLAVRTYP